MPCPRCGRDVERSARFCSQCGTPISPTQEQAPQPEETICEAILSPGKKIVFTNKRFQIHEVQQARSFKELRNPRYVLLSESPITKVKEVYSSVDGTTGFSRMVVRLNTGEELRCNSNAINARDFVFGSQTTMAMKTNAVVDRYVNQIMRAVERQSLHGAYAE